MCERTPEYEELIKQSKPFENQAEWKEMIKSMVKPIPNSAWTLPIPAKKPEMDVSIVYAPYVPMQIITIVPSFVETDERKYERAMEIFKNEHD